MASKDKLQELGKREAPPVVMIIGVVVLVLALGTGAFWAYNGGFKTQGQQDYDYQHNLLPIMAAKHGDTDALKAENELRKSHGDAPLEMPKDKKTTSMGDPDKLKKLQEQLAAHGGGQ